MNHKYTLLCNKGDLFRSGRHFLVLDRWFVPISGTSVLILCHGIMSEQEYQAIIQKQSIPVFQCVNCSWIGLYPMHESKKMQDTQFAGYLHRDNRIEWSGYLNVR